MIYEATIPFVPPNPPPLTDHEISRMGELIEGFHSASVSHLTVPGLSFSTRFCDGSVILEMEYFPEGGIRQRLSRCFSHCEARNNTILRKMGEVCCQEFLAVIASLLTLKPGRQ